MAAGESLSPYDDITSDELFDSFMDVVSSVEQSFNDEDIKDGKAFHDDPSVDICNTNGDIELDISNKNNENQFTSLIQTNNPIQLPLLVKLYKEPIYASCDDIIRNGDASSPLNTINNDTVVSDLDKPDLHGDFEDNNKCRIYESLDDIITSSYRHDVTTNQCNEIRDNIGHEIGNGEQEINDGEHETNDGEHDTCDKTSNLDDLSMDNSFDNTSNNDSFYSTVVMETEHTQTISDQYATVNKEAKHKNDIADLYAVVNKENKSIKKSTELSTMVKENPSSSDGVTRYESISSVSNLNNSSLVKGNVEIALMSKCDDPPGSPPVNDIASKNEYVEIEHVKSYQQSVSHDNYSNYSRPKENSIDHGYARIGNFKPSISASENSSSKDGGIVESPDIIFNAEQIAYGFNRSHSVKSDIYQSCINTIEKQEIITPQTPKASSGKDKRNFFGFGKWKSAEDTSKSPTSPTQTLSTDDLRKESRVLPNCSSHSIPVLCSGYLFKQGGSGFIPKNWRLRWFQLKKDNCLYYYKSEQDQIPFGAVILLRYQVSRALNVNKRFAFKLAKPGARTYYFAANSEEEMKKWMGHLNDAVKYAQSDHSSIPECSLKNVSIPAASIVDPDCQGFLSKQGCMHKSWRKRYCVLKYGCLFYYEDMADKVAIGVFKLHKYAIHKSENMKYGFEAAPPIRKMRTYYFYTNTETDTRRWMDAMRRSISSFQ